MMLNKTLQKALNEQLNLELQSWYSYLALSTYCERSGFEGFANWLNTQASEELEHSMKFLTYIQVRNGTVELKALKAPDTNFKGILEVFQTALGHEQRVSAAINDLYGLAVKEKDYATQAFLNWFVTEQIEEEKTVGGIVDALRQVGPKGDALLMLDREAGNRSTPV